MNDLRIQGNIVDVVNKRIIRGEIKVEGGIIKQIIENSEIQDEIYILPGFIDSHVHIESSMLVPSEFARMAFRHGTVACISDPHEIANVLGIRGVDYMIKNGNSSNMKFYFGAPSCVPATPFENAGAILSTIEIRDLMARDDIHFLSEVMNFPGVLSGFKEVLNKLEIARENQKPVDGHAPGLRGRELKKYIDSGISTDHESSSYEEALEKIELGMKILIREGSAAKNFDALYPLIDKYPEKVMLCTDDIHPDDLYQGHINLLLKKGLSKGLNLFNLLRSVTLNPKKHYNLKVGLLQKEDPADFVVMNNLKDFNIKQTYIDGYLVFDSSDSTSKFNGITGINKYFVNKIDQKDIKIPYLKQYRVIEIMDGEIITKNTIWNNTIYSKYTEIDRQHDILKLVVLNRYNLAKPAVAFVRGFNFKDLAVAQTIAHDSHNIISVGTADELIIKAIDLIHSNKGGIAVVKKEYEVCLPLPVAGLMSDKNFEYVINEYEKIMRILKNSGSKLHAPLMNLSFLALLVIPQIKLSDKGLFDVEQFKFVDLKVN
ncbi:adenine deaminase [Bacteroidota bacterium]